MARTLTRQRAVAQLCVGARNIGLSPRCSRVPPGNVLAVEDGTVLLLSRLDLETRVYHRDADAPWLSLLSPSLTPARYAAQLARTYGFEAALEAALIHTPLVASLVELRPRARLLAQDLFALDYARFGALPRALIAPFATVSEACGWLYASERSTHMFPMVAGHVLATLPQLTNAVSFLDDSEGPARREQLGAVFDQVAYTPRIANQIISAAHDAFRALTAWYSAPANEALRAGA